MARDFLTLNPPQCEYDESSEMQFSIGADGQQTATRWLQIDGRDFSDICSSLCGYSQVYSVVGGPNATAFRRYPPERNPLRDNLFVSKVDYVRPLGPPSQDGPFDSLQYQEIEVAVFYEPRPGVFLKGDESRPAGVSTWDESWRYILPRYEFGLHNRIIPNGVLRFCGEFSPISTDRVVPEPGVMLEPEATIFLTWMQVPAVLDSLGTPLLPGNLEANIAGVQGRINSTAFRGCPPLTLYCCAPKRELKSQGDGTLCWEIMYTLLQRGTVDLSGLDRTTITDTPDWTRLLGSDGRYHRVYRASQADPARSVYNVAEFKLLFTAN